MTVSSSSSSSATTANGPSSATTTTSTTVSVASSPPDATTLRTFAVILCSNCLYLEFPGCDVHGALYTERVEPGTRTGKLHAKCPSCTAATNNARPFREGCRRCKASTTVSMWNCSQYELEQALEAFPPATQEIAHTAVVCECCESAVFPRARETLALRTPQELMVTASGRTLKVSNFQLTMPHVKGCTRKGKPLQALAVHIPKSELKFVCERIERCPVATSITGGSQYRPRVLESITQQNHMHQICIRLLTFVINAFDANSPRAVEPLRQVVAMLGKLEPLAIFSDWAPPRRLSQEQPNPTKVTSSSDFDTQHEAQRVLEKGSDYWRSGRKTPDKPPRSEEWLVFQFDLPVALSGLELRWKSEFVPTHFSVGVSKDGTTYETVAIVVQRAVENRILISKRMEVTAIKLTMFTSSSSSGTFGLESIACKKALANLVHTSSGILLQNIQHWLLDAAVSPLPEVRELALKALQKLLLASGSLCGLLQLATCLVLNAPTTTLVSTSWQSWDELDLLSEDAQLAAQDFLKKLAIAVQEIVMENDQSSADENSLLDKRVMEKMSTLLHEEVAGPAPPVHPVASLAMIDVNPQTSAGELGRSQVKEDELRAKDAEGDSSSACFVTLLIGQPKFLHAIKRRSQLGMILLHMLSELSAWQMKRMQKAKEFTGKREEELLCLEEPLSMEICPEFFTISHRILTKVLARWLPGGYVKICLYPELHDEEEEEKQNGAVPSSHGCHSCHHLREHHDVYYALTKSFDLFRASLGETKTKNSKASLEQPQVEHKSRPELLFSPDGLCVSILQIITSNLRRLVLSRINPSDIGISPASLRNGDGLLSAPPALDPMVSSLEQLISLGTKRSDKFFPVSLKAAAAVEVGMEAFYPSANQRTKVLASRMGKGATLEVQVRWPVQERGQEDPRYERLILMLQFECIKLGIRHAIRGSWFFFMHLVVEVPSTRNTEEVLTQNFAPCIQRAGFSSWQVAAGAQELSINLQRHLHWNRVEKMCHDSGAGWIRVYPADVAAFDEVCSDVEGFLNEHGKHDSSKLLP